MRQLGAYRATHDAPGQTSLNITYLAVQTARNFLHPGRLFYVTQQKFDVAETVADHAALINTASVMSSTITPAAKVRLSV